MPGPAVLVLEGLAVSIAGTASAKWLFPGDAGLVGVFLGSLVARDSFERVLDHNRDVNYSGRVRPVRANLDTGVRIASLFVGCVLGYSIIGLGLPVVELQEVFSNQVRDAHMGDLARVDFGSFRGVFSHNVGVALLFFAVALPFRHGGVMLALCWNASVWGASFGVLARNMAQRLDLSVADCWLRVVTVHLPHLMPEALSFTLAGLAGTYLSLGVQRHALDAPVWPSILRSIWVIGGAALVALAVAAVVETSLGPWLAASLAR